MEQEIDRRINYRIVLDTETCPIDKTVESVDPYNMFTYDLGWAVVDKRGKVYKTESFVIYDIFVQENELMQSAYYNSKIPMYWEDIHNGIRKLITFYNARKQLLEDIATYNVTEIYAHNMRFDYGTLKVTQTWLTKSKYKYFFPKDILICDTLKMARDVILKMPTYRKFCEEYGLLTKNGRLSAKAEDLFRFIKKDPTFVESHTGLEDVMIEKEIMAYCFKQHKKMRKLLWEN